MDKKISVAFSDDAKGVYYYLKEASVKSKKERMLFKAINTKIGILRINPNYGDRIAKMLIPSDYENRYSVNNLLRVELPLFWRMLYTVVDKDKIEIVAFILDIIDHKKYSKKFGYKKK